MLPSTSDFRSIAASSRLRVSYRDQGKSELTIAIGGADGLDPSLYDRADATLCLGKMTWPHQLVRTLIAEQLY
ncbi:23S rRNA (pseudouridine(1915)-N(3))-methyltransferase RlmH, partial [Rhizobium ruizarguesonis]